MYLPVTSFDLLEEAMIAAGTPGRDASCGLTRLVVNERRRGHHRASSGHESTRQTQGNGGYGLLGRCQNLADGGGAAHPLCVSQGAVQLAVTDSKERHT